MSGRPEILFPLFAQLEGLAGVGPKSAQHFAQMGVEKPRDLIFTLPHSGISRIPRDSVQGAEPGEVVTVEVEITAHHPPRSRGRPYRVQAQDALTSFQIVFFHGKSDYLQRILPVGSRRVLSGKVEMFDGIVQMPHPDHIVAPDESETIPPYEPVYPLTAGITQKLIVRATQSALDRLPDLPEWIDPALKARETWPDWAPALRTAHSPADSRDLAATAPARQRLAYDEFFAHQLTLTLARARQRKSAAHPTTGDGHLRDRVLAALPY
ncbi:ATP-dependent DNA helicase RecG, partial [Escherichia coli]|nr:ATP-dependent DNA helicase RecG [Escherichia coli]